METAALIPTEVLALFAATIERHPVNLPPEEQLSEFASLVSTFVTSDLINYFHSGRPSNLSDLRLEHTPFAMPMLAPESNFRTQTDSNGNLYTSADHRPIERGLYGHFAGFPFIRLAEHAVFAGACAARVYTPPISTVIEAVPGLLRPLVNLYATTTLSVMDAPVRLQYVHPALKGHLVDVSVNFGDSARHDVARLVAEHKLLREKNSDLLRLVGYRRPAASECLNQLESAFGSVIQNLVKQARLQIAIPPIAAVLLHRLPDNCTNVGHVIRELLELRDQWSGFRSRFNRIESIVRDPKSSLRDLQLATVEIEADAKRFENEFGTSAGRESVDIAFGFDTIIAITRLCSLAALSNEAVVSVLKPAIPKIEEFAARARTSIAFRMAREAMRLSDYRTLAHQKLGIQT
ncbi:MAG: hypothetical protein KIT24_03620 [Phycisphaeraceae bacterium]|nr:hypothetical protein [Phycisphaeraceae bacterium]